MAGTSENSPPSGTPSNGGLGRIGGTTLEAALERTLRSVLEASGAERAYLVARGTAHDGSAASVCTFLCDRDDGRSEPSQGVLEHALSVEGTWLSLDADRDRRFDTSASIRQLALRSIACGPVIGSSFRGALVLDSRGEAELPADRLRDLVASSCAFMAQLAVPPRSQEPPPAGTGRPPESGESSAASWLERVARCELPVLVLGETGSGKERVAREVHDRSPRRDGPFVAINCAAFTHSLLDAELFGAMRGSYTGADRDRPGLFRIARGGTLFLDEVGDMPAPMQAKILRVLENRRARAVGAATDYPVDVRVVSATHRDLRNDSETRFRSDLYYRLAVLEVHVRPLRERIGELPSVIEALTPRLRREIGIQPSFREDTIARLARHDWPGNVRELHSVLARAVLRSAGEIVRPDHLDLLLRSPSAEALVECGTGQRGEALEGRMIRQALQNAGGSVTEAAQRIGWTRQKLYRRLAALGLTAQYEV